MPEVASSESSLNVVVLVGVLSRRPERRQLPSGDSLVSLAVSTRRPGQRADTVPVTMFSPPGSIDRLDAGDRVVVAGRIQRRFFRHGGRTDSRTQVTADRIVPAGHRGRTSALFDHVERLLDQTRAPD